MTENPFTSPRGIEPGPESPLEPRELKSRVLKEGMRVGARSAVPTANLIMLVFPATEFVVQPMTYQWYYPLLALGILASAAFFGSLLGYAFGGMGGFLVGGILALLTSSRLTNSKPLIYFFSLLLCPLWGVGVGVLYRDVITLDGPFPEESSFALATKLFVAIGAVGGLCGGLWLARCVCELRKRSALDSPSTDSRQTDLAS